MPIDPNIILSGSKPVEIQNPLNAMAQVLQIKHARQQLDQQDFANQEAQRNINDQNKLRVLMQGMPADITDEQRVNTMRGAGYFDAADKLQTSNLARLKTTSDANLSNAHADNFKQQSETSSAANKYIAATHHAQLINRL